MLQRFDISYRATAMQPAVNSQETAGRFLFNSEKSAVHRFQLANCAQLGVQLDKLHLAASSFTLSCLADHASPRRVTQCRAAFGLWVIPNQLSHHRIAAKLCELQCWILTVLHAEAGLQRPHQAAAARAGAATRAGIIPRAEVTSECAALAACLSALPTHTSSHADCLCCTCDCLPLHVTDLFGDRHKDGVMLSPPAGQPADVRRISQHVVLPYLLDFESVGGL